MGFENVRVFASEENLRREWVVKCLENPHNSSIPKI